MCDSNPDGGIGVDWVDVSAEPNHVEQFRSDVARVYEVTIMPGTATLYHRHDRDTVYVITAGGRFRSQEPGHQRSRTSLGHSTGLLSQLGLLAARLTHGWLQVPAGTVILQPHKDFPLIHRVHAHRTNPGSFAPGETGRLVVLRPPSPRSSCVSDSFAAAIARSNAPLVLLHSGIR